MRLWGVGDGLNWWYLRLRCWSWPPWKSSASCGGKPVEESGAAGLLQVLGGRRRRLKVEGRKAWRVDG